MQTTPATHPSKSENEVIDHSEDTTQLTTPVATESSEAAIDNKSSIEEVNKVLS